MKNTLIIIGAGNSTLKLLEYGFHRIPPHIDTLATTRSYRFCESLNWWPTLYSCLDPKVVKDCANDLQPHISNPMNPVRCWFICTNHKPWDVKLDDPFGKIVHVPWGASGGTSAVVFCQQDYYKRIVLIGIDNDYIWDRNWVEPLPGNDNRVKYKQDMPKHPCYFWPNYLKKGDVVSWSSGNWSQEAKTQQMQAAVNIGLSKGKEIINLGNIPLKNCITDITLEEIFSE